MFPLSQRADGAVYNGGMHPDQLMGGADYYSQLGLDPTYGEYLEVSETVRLLIPQLFFSLAPQSSTRPSFDEYLYHVLNGARISCIQWLPCVQEGIREFGDPGVVLPRPDEVVMATEPMGDAQYDYEYYWPGDYNHTASSGPPLG